MLPEHATSSKDGNDSSPPGSDVTTNRGTMQKRPQWWAELSPYPQATQTGSCLSVGGHSSCPDEGPRVVSASLCHGHEGVIPHSSELWSVVALRCLSKQHFPVCGVPNPVVWSQFCWRSMLLWFLSVPWKWTKEAIKRFCIVFLFRARANLARSRPSKT